MKIVFEGTREHIYAEVAKFANDIAPRTAAVQTATTTRGQEREYPGLRMPNIARLGRRAYTRGEIALMRRWYADPLNHYVNGLVIGKKLAKFAKEVRRTPMALTVAFQHFGISRRRVRGVVPQRISTASRAPMPRRVPLPSLRVATHKTPEYRAKQAENMKRIWAKRKAQQMAATVAIIKGSAQERDVRRLKDIGLGEDLINSGLQYAAASGEFTQLAGISLGIDSEQWAALCEYVIANGDALQNKYGKRFKVVRDGGEKRIVVAS